MIAKLRAENQTAVQSADKSALEEPSIINQDLKGRREEIAVQQELLKTHRRTLAHYLKQKATHSSAYVPPAIAHGI
jgi:hypothetical protein